MKLRLTARPLVLALALALGLGACGGGGSSQAGPPRDQPAIKVLSPFPPNGAFTAPMLYAAAKGSFDKHGVKVEITDGKTSLSVANAVAQGEADIGMVGSSVTAQVISRGGSLISIAQMYGKGSYGLIVPTDSSVRTLNDVAGKQVIESAGSPETVLLPATIQKLGAAGTSALNVDATVKGSTYSSGRGEALATSIPFFLPIVTQGRPSRAIPFTDADVQFPDYSIVTRPDFLRERPDEVRKFLTAFFESFNAAGQDLAGVGKALVELRPSVTNPDLQVAQFEAYQSFLCSSNQAGHPVGWHSDVDWAEGLAIFKEFGGLTGPIDDLGKFYTNEFFDGPNAVSAKLCGAGAGS
ncbi:ABC transporter substrate-binding protein [Pseudonocardia sp. H11422]|uniref:ABC transporter substrate-binding protein n=1 Tax=Pseudonocardia sp. H11422 TaxID=2835866 RepID=UPI001BDC717A|nr:ABC transporter substrate-binding protein [Pseudonocardia sp. H11422]